MGWRGGDDVGAVSRFLIWHACIIVWQEQTTGALLFAANIWEDFSNDDDDDDVDATEDGDIVKVVGSAFSYWDLIATNTKSFLVGNPRTTLPMISRRHPP